MEATLHALGGILLRAVPTFLLVVVLHFYLKKMYFQPMQKILHRRREATEGARKAAEQSTAHAAARTAEYEAAIRAARSEVYRTQEALQRELQEKESVALAEARQRADAVVRDAKAQLASDVAGAKASLDSESDALAEQIAESILRRRAA